MLPVLATRGSIARNQKTVLLVDAAEAREDAILSDLIRTFSGRVSYAGMAYEAHPLIQ